MLGVIGARIRQLRRSKGLTEADLAARVGVSRSFLNAIERGVVRLRVDLMVRIADALGVSPEDLLKEVPASTATRP
ncbi:helix-turn-helix transcriptional regulator [Thermus sp.]|uniref:helix-turn-helix domain-containing protein n=1 Tax=Thermus sp. TaxID=275 RepID=UPI00343F138F